MSFPHHDPIWSAVARFLQERVRPSDRILAPDDFWWLFPEISRYINTRLRPDEEYDWIVVHKGAMDHLTRRFLERLSDVAMPVLANEVFVVWAARPVEPDAELANSDHLRAFHANLECLTERDLPPDAADLVLPDQGRIRKFSAMAPAEFRAAMDAFWRNGGYIYETLRDRTYYAEIDQFIADYVRSCEGNRLLDLCCGTGRLGGILTRSERILGVDVSGAALRMATERHRDRPEFMFATMDAHRLALPDETFDTVLFVDAIEHVNDAEQVLAEAARVLKPGGALFLTAANRNGLNQRIARKLGHQEFVTNYQHMREFDWEEVRAMLRAIGLHVTRSDGLFLYPYWGVPQIDEVVRHLTDDDPEVVEAMRVLGRRAGPDYAYSFVALARKQRAP